MMQRRYRTAAGCGLVLAGLLLSAPAALAEGEAAAADTARECEQQDDCRDTNGLELVPVFVEAELPPEPGHNRYDEEDIAEMPTADGHLSDLLRLNTAVSFSRDSNLSANSGTLKPGEISIHGQPFYQNLFVIDGMDVSSDLNPADHGDVWSTPSLVGPVGGSSPQGYFVDVDLLESVEVFDSNVPAEYGGFTGGVVSTRLKRYDGTDRYKVRYGVRRDEWESFHVDDDTREDTSNYRGEYTPDYLRQDYSASLQQGLGGDSGVTMNISRRSSRFDQTYEDSEDVVRTIEYEDRIDNVLGRYDTRLGATDLGLSFRYAERTHDGLTSSTYDDTFQQHHQGFGTTLQLGRTFDPGRLDVDVGFDHLGDSVDSESDTFYYREYLEGQAGYQQGGFGDTEQGQNRVTLAPAFTFDTLAWGETRHHVKTGTTLRRTHSHYERLDDVAYLSYSCVDDAATGCVDQNGDGESGEEDAYLAQRFDYYAGEVSLDYTDLSWFLEDRVERGNWTFTPGIRADWNDFLDNVDVAPRLKIAWDTFGDGSTRLIAGANRYYGRSFFRYQLKDAIYGWRRSRFYDEDGNLTRELTYDDRSGASDLDTPYSDELMAGWVQALGPVTARLQFVNRESRDGVMRVEDDDGLYHYTNDGHSSTDSVTLDIALADPWRLGGTVNDVSLGLSYRDTERSSYQGDEGYDTEPEEDRIYYEGRVIRKDELPAWDYNVPISVRLQTATRVPSWNLTWSNFVSLRQGGTVAQDTGEDYEDPDTGGEYDVYEDRDFSRLVTVDTRLRWEPALWRDNHGFVQLEIDNLFDQTVDNSTSDYTAQYTAGRRGRLELGLTF